MADRRPFRGLKQEELRNCILCDRGMAHDASMSFFRLTIERLFLDGRAINRQHGLELMLGGGSGNAQRDAFAATIARAMGPNDELAITRHAPAQILVCEDCAIRNRDTLFELWSAVFEKMQPEINLPPEKPSDGR